MGLTSIILAAGRGSRLGHYGESSPKCLVPLAGETLIDRQLRVLRSSGVEDVVIVTGYKSELLSISGTRQAHNSRWAETNMVESLFIAEDYFGDDMIVSYGDIVYELGVINALRDSNHDISIVVDQNWRLLWQARFADPLSDAETLLLKEDRILEIGQKPESYDQIHAQYIGLMRFKNSGIQALREARENLRHVERDWMAKRTVANAYMTDLIMEMILMGQDVRAVPIKGGWIETDTQEDLEMYEHKAGDGSLKELINLP